MEPETLSPSETSENLENLDSNQQPETQPAEAPASEPFLITAAQLEQVVKQAVTQAVAEAGKEAYLRGRNDAVTLAMPPRDIWEAPHVPEQAASDSTTRPLSESDKLFLQRIRPTVWD